MTRVGQLPGSASAFRAVSDTLRRRGWLGPGKSKIESVGPRPGIAHLSESYAAWCLILEARTRVEQLPHPASARRP